jgi:hypothetical protein
MPIIFSTWIPHRAQSTYDAPTEFRPGRHRPGVMSPPTCHLVPGRRSASASISQPSKERWRSLSLRVAGRCPRMSTLLMWLTTRCSSQTRASA